MYVNKQKPGKIVLVLCALLLLSGAVWLAVALFRLRDAALAVQADVKQFEALAAGGAQDLDIDRALALFDAAHSDLEALRRAATPFVWAGPYMGWLPRYGPDLQAAPALLDIAGHLADAGDVLKTPFAPLLRKAMSQDQVDRAALVREAWGVLQAARPQLRSALASVQKAQLARDEIGAARLSPRFQAWLARLDLYLPLLAPGIEGALLLPELAGVDGPRTYLLLVQNQDELRATGGFISAVAQVTVEQGAVTALQFQDSYAVDDFTRVYPDPPAPLLEYMLSELWVFRDSNWSPDFPTSARAAVALYKISREVEIDGVIALDQRAIQLLIDAIGPLQVKGQSKPLTGQNVIEMVQQAWGAGQGEQQDWWWHRKDFMIAALGAIVERFEGGLGQEGLARLARAVHRSLQERHLIVYVEEREAAALLAGLGWDGAIRQTTGDYVMVVDANVGFNKANVHVEQRLEYAVDLTNLAQPRATLIVSHTHLLPPRAAPCLHTPRYDETYALMSERCYWNYLRVYVPAGSRLVHSTPHEVPGALLLSGRASPARVAVGPPECGRDVWATFLLLQPAETLTTRFDYVLPPGALQIDGRQVTYRLTVQKQPGTLAVPLRVRIALAGRAVIVRQSPGAVVSGATIEYELALDTDRVLELVFQMDVDDRDG